MPEIEPHALAVPSVTKVVQMLDCERFDGRTDAGIELALCEICGERVQDGNGLSTTCDIYVECVHVLLNFRPATLNLGDHEAIADGVVGPGNDGTVWRGELSYQRSAGDLCLCHSFG